MCCLSWLALQTRWGGELRACDEEAGWGAELSPCSPLCSPSSFLGPAPTNRPLAVAMQQAALPGSVQQTAEQQAAATKPIGGAAWGCPLLFSLLSSLSHPSPSLHPLLDRSSVNRCGELELQEQTPGLLRGGPLGRPTHCLPISGPPHGCRRGPSSTEATGINLLS